jgi:hypothetical protein
MRAIFQPSLAALCVLGLVAAGQLPAQQLADAAPASPELAQQTYQRVLKQVEAIPIFDNHSHPGYADDPDVDAMAAPPGNGALRLRADNPELIAASKDLFGYPFDDASPEHLQWLSKKKAELRSASTGDAYFSNILDRLNIEQALANRVRLAPYLSPKRFRWVFFVDSVLFPFDNRSIVARNGDEAVYVPLQEKKLRNELAQEGLNKTPASFDAYLAFVTRLLEDNQRHGGVAIKFEIAYFRPLQFADPGKQAAETIYARYHAGGVPEEREYLLFQDYLFRYLVREAGRLHLPVHIHTAVGIGDYFNVSGGNVMNLENILRDPRYESTTFVLLHGGYPFQDQAIWLAARKNVYLDTSLMELYLYPEEFSQVLRRWLLLYPDKVVFGSDAFPFNDAVGAEESYWIAVHSARAALAAALSQMIVQNEITEDKALSFARAYLHDTAERLYPR